MRNAFRYIPILNSIVALGEYILDCVENREYNRLWRDFCELVVVFIIASFAVLYIIANSPSYKNNYINQEQTPDNISKEYRKVQL